MLRAPVLVLNLNYEPINVCDVRRALVLLGKGKAEILENGRGEIRTPSAVFTVPSVIRLVYLVKRPFSSRKLSKREVLLRDRFTCQYCGTRGRDMTIDHVIPRRLGGKDAWENVVTACKACNRRKAGRTPQQAGMRLLRKPRAPYPTPYYVLYNRPILEEWKKFVPWADLEPHLAQA